MQLFIGFLAGMCYAFAVVGLLIGFDEHKPKKIIPYMILSILCAIGAYLAYQSTIY